MPNVNPHADNDYALRAARYENHNDVANFLACLDKPSISFGNISKDDLINALIKKEINANDLQKIIKSMK